MYLAIDIDDTLCHTTLRRMRLFQERFGNPEGCTAEELIEKYEIVQWVPYRQTHEATKLLSELLEDDSSRITIPVIPKSLEAVKLLATHTQIKYVTSRTECHRFRTIMRLEEYNFPLFDIVMRPDVKDILTEDKEQFSRKADYLCEQYPDIYGIIDNSKSLSKQLQERNYKGENILFGHTTLSEQSPAIHLQSRNDIQKIIDIIK